MQPPTRSQPPDRPSKWKVGAVVWGAILFMFLVGIVFKFH
jgi:hypothetical protein